MQDIWTRNESLMVLRSAERQTHTQPQSLLFCAFEKFVAIEYNRPSKNFRSHHEQRHRP